MVTIRGRVWLAVVAAALIGMSTPSSAGFAFRQAPTTTPATPQSKPESKKAPKTPSKSGTSSSDAGKASGLKTKGTNGKAGAGASGKTGSKASGKSSSKASGKKGAAGRKHHVISRKPTAQTIRLTSAFKASEQLRPMAQQLAATRSAAAYSGVEGYARQHPGEGAAAAYLALGHAAMLDHRYDDAVRSYRQANVSGTALDDYADYLGAQAAIQGGHGADAYGLLYRFAERHPESIYDARAPVLLANAHLQQNDPQGALRVLVPLADSAPASHVDFRYALGRAYQMSGDTTHAAATYRGLYVNFPPGRLPGVW